MKRFLIAALIAAAAGSMFAQAPAAAPAKFRKVKIMNGDYAIPSSKGIIGWRFQSREFSGDMEVVTVDKVKALKITPKETDYSKKTKVLRAICMNAGTFRAAKGDTVKYDVEFKGENGAIIGFILYDGRRNHWVKWQVKCDGKWQKGSYTMKMKHDALKSMFAADVFHKSVTLKPVKVSVQKAAE